MTGQIAIEFLSLFAQYCKIAIFHTNAALPQRKVLGFGHPRMDMKGFPVYTASKRNPFRTDKPSSGDFFFVLTNPSSQADSSLIIE